MAAPALEQATIEPTQALACWVAGLGEEGVTDSALTWSKHALLDWLGVAFAGAREPVTEMLVADALADGAHGNAPVLGRAERLIPSQAALVNGTAGHALDYDDVSMRMHGHPSAPVVPALLALAEQRQTSGRALLTAFIAGYEVECVVNEMLGDSHYEDGWHATATVGTFGAAAACAKLLGLDAAHTAAALGIAATQAAGLKCMFGTMCKPLQVGKAAANGLLAARLAARGFSSRTDALGCVHGFGATLSKAFEARPVRPERLAPLAIESNLFKYHAACYLTHSPIEAAAGLRREHNLDPKDVARVEIHVGRGHLTVCNIASPSTGLESKFSLRHAVALALSGESTDLIETYSDALANRADLVALRNKMEVRTKAFAQRTGAEVTLELRDGARLTKSVDVGVPATDLHAQWSRLESKFKRLTTLALSEQRAAHCIEACRHLESAHTLNELLADGD